MTPAAIAEEVRDALKAAQLGERPQVARYLGEALDAISDGMPADYVAMILYAALGAAAEL